MSALIYIVRRNFINRLKKRLRRPLTYVSVVFFVLTASVLVTCTLPRIRVFSTRISICCPSAPIYTWCCCGLTV